MQRKIMAICVTAGAVGLGAAGLVSPPHVASQSAVTPKMQAPNEARALSRAFAAVAKALQPSVVRIDVESAPKLTARDNRRVPPELERLFERFLGEDFELPTPGPGKGTGSGLMLDTAGHIITNSHVVAEATKVTVTFSDGREFPAKLVGRDAKTDVAVMKLDKAPSGLIAARLGDSGKVEVGEWVLAVGSPLGLDQSVTAGIISGKGRVGRNVQMSGERVREYIQTDAKINPGNSGGPLVNLEGEVIGINTQINMGPGGAYGFAIPINQVRRVAQTIISDGRVKHAYLGILLEDIKGGVRMGRDGDSDHGPGDPIKGAPGRAAVVAQVLPNTPAQKAGVHAGDVITQIDGQKIEGASDVIDYVSSRSVGSKVSLAYTRDGRSGTLQVTLGELPANPGDRSQDRVESDAGVSLQTLTPDVAPFLKVDPLTKGAVVTEVAPNSRAGKAGLRSEDVIIEIDRKPVATADEANAALATPGAHMLRVKRGGVAQLINVPGR